MKYACFVVALSLLGNAELSYAAINDLELPGPAIAQKQTDTSPSAQNRGKIKPQPEYMNKKLKQLVPTPLTPADLEAKVEIETMTKDVTTFSGAIFLDPEQVDVKPPMLSALISLNKLLSPFNLDATSQKDVNLKDVLDAALDSNLTIKISKADLDNKKWQYISTFGNYLPNLSNDIQFQGLSGDYVSPVGLVAPIHNPYLTTLNSFQWYLFKGGYIVYSNLEAKHNYYASKYHLSGDTQDILFEATKLYYGLVLNDVLLQIWIKMRDYGQALVLVNKDLYTNGVNTELDVLQAEYQLSHDRQELIKQQIARRESAVNLATALNWDQGQDLDLADRLVRKTRLVDQDLNVADLLQIAVNSRPELKKYEQLRLAALDKIKVMRSYLLPQVAGSGSIIGTGSRVFTSSGSSTTTSLSTSGVGAGSVSGASSLPLSGSSSGAKEWTTRALFVIGVDVQWNLGGMALTEAANVQAAKAEARRVTLEFNRNLERTYQEVRDAYLSSTKAENLIVETTDAVNYAREELRVSVVRLQDGVGTYLDVINAQRDYTSALIDKANALIDYNQSQAKILRAIGKCSVATLTSKTPLKGS